MLGWTFCVLGWPVLILGLFGLFKQFVMLAQNRLMLEDVVTVLVLLSLGFPFAYFGTALLGPRFLFDTTSRELTIRRFGRTRRRPLADILAVQMINAGLFGSNNSDGDERFVSYQLNLSLDDRSEPRLHTAFVKLSPAFRESVVCGKIVKRVSVDGSASMERPSREPKWHPSQIYVCETADARPITR